MPECSDDSRVIPVPSTLVIGGRAVDGRTIPAKRYKAVMADLAADAGGEPSTAAWLLISRAAGLTVQLEQMEAVIASGGAADVEAYAKLTGALVRVLNTLGLGRKARDITPKVVEIDAHARAVKRANG